MPTTDEESGGRRIRGVRIALSIVDLLQRERARTLSGIADELGHSKSTVHSHLKTLEDEEMVVREPDGYRLSLRILDLARGVRDQVGNSDVIEEEVEALAAETGEIAQFGIEEYGRVSYLYKARGARAVETASTVGTQQPIYSTSLGKAILAYLPAERRAEVIDACEFEPLTAHTVTDPERLREQLAEVRERGYGLDNEENIDGLRCVAAPVRDDETVFGAVSISGPSSRFTDDRIEGELAERVRRAANVIELNTKFSTD
ncbi:IclR family transcriptional regulator [Candidatus Halobonum tyrrellensis]|uniref:ArcR family transcription regulator n=1 Tax=Candidatus Halobonum tyrrellensis G22 TaxID=1324957 RepID=V4HQK0_9EURY|nr:IclR family transcriptional regulator [Candidatus Halobonum tyrrellensis]ESP90194.1 ArcR family transcription regulator [Candidatus Halobonum tyrrellensis G22]